MSEEIKKTGRNGEIADQDLDTFAGGGLGDPIGGVGIGLGKHPNPGQIAPSGGVNLPSPTKIGKGSRDY